MLNAWTIILQIMNIEEWKLLELRTTQTRNPLSILWKMSKFKTPKNEKQSMKYVQNTKKQSMKYVQNTKVHIFNVWSITMQSLNKKEWKLSELQITQTRHPLHISDGKMSKFNTR